MTERLNRCKEIVRIRKNSLILFSDEKLFMLQQAHNPQNDRVWSVSLNDIHSSERFVERKQGSKSIMVWAAVSIEGKWPLLFIDKGVKINSQYYLDTVLRDHVLRYAPMLFGNKQWVLQQDNAPAHTTNVVQNWCSKNLHAFIDKKLWPPSSPDLNPLDFSIWRMMSSKLTNIDQSMSIDEFKNKLNSIWRDLPIENIKHACKAFIPRCKAVIKAKGGKIENILK